MAKRAVVWTETAARQRQEILRYWVERNGTTTYAEKLIRLTAQQLKAVQSNPKLFKKADFPDTHVAALGHFSIYSRLTKHGSQRAWPKSKLEVDQNLPAMR